MRAGMSTTDMVRCRSSVEQTRLIIVEVLSKEPDEDDEMELAETESDTVTGNDTENEDTIGSAWDDDDDGLYMDVARVYEHTIVQLGERLGDVFGAPIRAATTPLTLPTNDEQP